MVDTARTGLPRPERVRPCALSSLGAGAVQGADVEVTGITAASDLVRAGDLFAALPGRTAHGIAFAPAALAAGAVAVLTDQAGLDGVPAEVPVVVVPDVRRVLGPTAARIYGDPSARLRMLGVTGTSGKTTTTFLMRAALQAAGHRTGLIGTVATLIEQEQVRSRFTTPEAPEIQSLLAVMDERGVTDVAMEVSSHALRMGRVDGIGFDVSAFTNLSEDHLDFHTDMADYFAAKASLFDERTERSVVVVDDAWGARLAAALADPVTVSTSGGPATWQAEQIAERADGATTFRVRGPGVDLRTGCAIPGRYNVANVVVALAVLHEAGLDVAAAAEAVSVASVPGRMERIDVGQHFLAVVDYSHKPAAVEGALHALRPLTKDRLIVVLGCGGDRDTGKRPHMGEIAARGADLLVVTDDNPRSEDPAAIRRAVLGGALAVPPSARGEVIEIGDRAEAIAHAVAVARPGDTVLVAGKGHETGQEVEGVTHPFDDRDVLRTLLRESSQGRP